MNECANKAYKTEHWCISCVQHRDRAKYPGFQMLTTYCLRSTAHVPVRCEHCGQYADRAVVQFDCGPCKPNPTEGL
jgi:hypothetical protein